MRSCGLPTKRARARRYSSAGGAEESEGDEYGICGLLYKANRRIIGNPPCHVNGDVAVCLGPGSTSFQPAAAGEGCLENFHIPSLLNGQARVGTNAVIYPTSV